MTFIEPKRTLNLQGGLIDALSRESDPPEPTIRDEAEFLFFVPDPQRRTMNVAAGDRFRILKQFVVGCPRHRTHGAEVRVFRRTQADWDPDRLTAALARVSAWATASSTPMDPEMPAFAIAASSTLSPAESARQEFFTGLAEIREVLAVDDLGTTIRVIVPRRNGPVGDRVYDLEDTIRDRYPEAGFDVWVSEPR
jgi:hypothetical protein